MPIFEEREVYIATKAAAMERQAGALMSRLERLGYKVTYDWTNKPCLKPYGSNAKESRRAAKRMANAAMRCDIMVVLWAEHGLGYHIETGIAIGAAIARAAVTGRKEKRIYVVGMGSEDRSVFYHHPFVTCFPDEESLLETLSRDA